MIFGGAGDREGIGPPAKNPAQRQFIDDAETRDVLVPIESGEKLGGAKS